ncbi:hypothetical protein D3C84_1236390 [compost metagenome]
MWLTDRFREQARSHSSETLRSRTSNNRFHIQPTRQPAINPPTAIQATGDKPITHRHIPRLQQQLRL